MKVITLDRIVDYITDKHGNQSISKTSIKDEDNCSGVVYIHDRGTVCPEAYLNHNDELEFNNCHNRVHCILLETDMEDFHSPNPFIKAREALSGVLVIDNDIPSESELEPYMYRI